MTRLPVRPLVLTLMMALASAVLAQRAHAASITVAGGCFWCVEADFERVRGVREVVSGYTGGASRNPTYKQVTKGGTGHYEAVRIEYNPGQIDARRLYDLFFRSVDPTDAGGQFCDRGQSYRTAIFVSNAAQKQAAKAAKAAAEAELGRKIVTPILDAGPFYKAEAYHQNYYKSAESTLTRFGYIQRKDAYKRYRKACGRDARVKQLWGGAASFSN